MKKKVILIPNIIYLICLFIILYVINIDKSIVNFIIVCGAYLLFELVSLILIMKNKENEIKKDVLNSSVILKYVTCSIILSLVLVLYFLNIMDNNLLIIVSVLEICVYYIDYYLINSGKNHVISNQEKVLNKTKNVKEWLNELKLLKEETVDNKLKKELENAIDELRFSNLSNYNNSKEFSDKINDTIKSLKNNINSKDIKDLIKLIKKANIVNKNVKE